MKTVRNAQRARMMWFVVVVAIAPAVSKAQTADPQAAAMAQKLVEEAGDLMDAGNFAEACPKLEQATAILPEGIGAKMALGECYVGLDKPASAWAQYARAEALAIAKGDSRASEAREKADEQKPKLATLKIVVPEATRKIEGLSITWNGLAQEEAAWGTPMPVDIGHYTIEATAPGRRAWTHEVVIETNAKSYEQEIPPLELLTIEKPKVSPTSTAPLPVQKPKTSTKWMLPIGIAGLGTGAVGVVIGSVLGSVAMSKNDASNSDGECDAANFCNARGVTLRDEAFSFANGSTASFIVGGLFLAAGGTLVAVSLRDSEEPRSKDRASIRWRMDVAPTWIGVNAAW